MPAVALVHGSRRYDGHAVHFRMYWTALANRRYPVSVYTCVDPSSASEYPDWGTPILGRRLVRWGRIEEGFNRLFPVYAKKIGSLPEELVHVNDVYLAPAARFRDRVLVSVADLATAYTSWHPRIPTWIHNRNMRSLNLASGIICHSEFVRKELATHTQIPEHRVHLVPLFSMLPPGSAPTEESRRPPTPDAPWKVLYVATDRPWKNLAFFLEVLRRLDDRFRGVLVSRLTPSTKRLVSSWKLGTRLDVMENQPNLLGVYRASHLFLFPSQYEGFGIPLLEAMSQGLPVLASDRTAVPETVGTGGEILPLDDSKVWADAVSRLTEWRAYERASRKALERSRQFTSDLTADRLISAYASSEQGVRSQPPSAPARNREA